MSIWMRAFLCGCALAVAAPIAGYVAYVIDGRFIEGAGWVYVGVGSAPVAFVVGWILGATGWAGRPTGDGDKPGPPSDGSP